MKRLIKLLIISIFTFSMISIKAEDFTITYDANGGFFSNGTSTNTVTKRITTYEPKVSHTSNVDDTGLKTDNYGNGWNNSNITGTDRGDTSKAHVITFEGATTLTVDVYYNGESTSYDYVCVWAGNNPNYTADNNCGSSLSGRLGDSQSGTYEVNGNTLTSMGHKTYTINGDSVTFAFRSDGSGVGAGYGYYAVVNRNAGYSSEGTYEQPTNSNSDLFFIDWYSDKDCSQGNIVDPDSLTETTTVYAKWYKYAFNVISGDIRTIGSEVTIGNEHFYVLGWEDYNHVKLLTKYNLGAGNGFATPTNRQDETAKGWYEGGRAPFKGSTQFASSCYWCVDIPPQERYIYNENSTLYPYVEGYVSYLRTLGPKVTGRLMSKTDLENAVNNGNHLDGGKLTETASDAQGKEWLWATSYWLGSVYLNDYIWMVASESNSTTWAWGVDVTWGVRPVIIVELDKEPVPDVDDINSGKIKEKVKGVTEIKENPKTGVFSYIVLPIVLISLLSFGYYKTRKRDLIKKI